MKLTKEEIEEFAYSITEMIAWVAEEAISNTDRDYPSNTQASVLAAQLVELITKLNK